MIEAVFGQSACGSLKMAQSWGEGPYPNNNLGVFLRGEGGRKPTRAQLRGAQKRLEEARRKEWQAAVPLGGSPADVYGFALALGLGDISEARPGPRRRQALEQLNFSPAPEAAGLAARQVCEANEALAALLDRAAAGEAVRAWYSDTPDEACGLCWLMAQLDRLGGRHGPVSVVKLPSWEYDREQNVVEPMGWGGVSPGDWGKHLPLETPAHPAFLRLCAMRWAELQNENAPLRAVVNGRLVSLPASFYDPFIEREIAAAPETFSEPPLIARLLGHYQLGLGDGWLALRIQGLVEAGRLQVVCGPAPGDPLYARTLKKCPGRW